ncbi:Slp family lipoprotein [Aerosticca soli]|uniref:Starvation lipoprotein Slp paralog n=1 Tax=Aerosticca soli TaxID=2010829 RepID=A0A2Z6E4C1_9GAMM|nr:Slp family lipoprotein [Aerosticca soli]MDI3261916.1 Slp family lipoprotein [Fulvimonas sp.]BBD79621.1 starvation lipoprotein Slp paralog [Aerosticca soli]
MSALRLLALAATALLLAACATIPKPLEGIYPDVPLQTAQQGGASGTRVRWGGEIIQTEPGQEETCFYVLAHPLDSQARPKLDDKGNSQGRFIACRKGFYDPEVFARGREITVVGTLHGLVTKKVGQYEYAYPRVEADVVYLWPKRPVYVRYPPGYYDPFWGDPFWGPWGPYYWGPYPYWGSRVIVVHPRPAPPPHPPHPRGH